MEEGHSETINPLGRSDDDPESTEDSEDEISEKERLCVLAERRATKLKKLLGVDAPVISSVNDTESSTVYYKFAVPHALIKDDQNWECEGDPSLQFSLEQKLGEGIFGTVHRSLSLATSFVLAIKSVKLGQMRDNAEVLLKEVEMLTYVRNQNIVSYFSRCIYQDKFWLFTEYCAKGSLVDLMQDLKKNAMRLEERDIIYLLRGVVAGLACLHDNGILHRNIRAENVLFSDSMGVKLGDYGTAHLFAQCSLPSKVLWETSLYSSPELLKGGQPDQFSDVWAIGILAILLADGELPYANLPTTQAIFKICTEPSPTVKRPESWSQHFHNFVATSLIAEPQNRPNARTLKRHAFLAFLPEDYSPIRLISVKDSPTPEIPSSPLSSPPQSPPELRNANIPEPDQQPQPQQETQQPQQLQQPELPLTENMATVPQITKWVAVKKSSTAHRLLCDLSPRSRYKAEIGEIERDEDHKHNKKGKGEWKKISFVSELNHEVAILRKRTQQLELALARAVAANKLLQENQSAITINLQEDPIEYHEALGGGGSGCIVYRCSVKGYSFAAKVLHKIAQPEDYASLVKEIGILMQLKHDNIVRYLGSEVTSKGVKMYMELYSGTLRDVIKSQAELQRSIPRRDVIQYLFQIVKGLHYLHSQNPPIIHRDLKSDNIFCVWDGQKRPTQLRIGDFDISKVLNAGAVTYTHNVGTPGFIAPEIFSNDGKTKDTGHGTSADIWSLGMVVYELMTLKRPYHDVPFFRVSATNATGVRPLLTKEMMEEYSKGLVRIFNRCTKKDPARRPSAKKLLGMFGKL